MSDGKAMNKAVEALTRIHSHEETCSKRYQNIIDNNNRIHDRIDKLAEQGFKQWLVVAGGVIITLISIVGYLAKELLK